MAFSMFMRNSATVMPLFRQQVIRLASQSCLTSNGVSFLPASSVLKQGVVTPPSTPIYNGVRDFRTTPVPAIAPTAMPHNEHPHDHAKMWVIEKSVTMILFAVLPAGLMFPHKYLDIAMAVLMCAHSHWGLEAIAVDYVRASVFGPILPKVALGLVYLLSIATLGGLFYLIGHDVGIANTIRNLWSVKSEQQS